MDSDKQSTNQTTGTSGATGGTADGSQPGATTDAGTETSTTAPPAPSGLSKDEISALVKSAVGEVAAQRPAPEDPPEVMLAKFEKAFNVHKFDPKAFEALGYQPEQLESVVPFFEQLRDGLVRQAVTMANYQIGLMREEMMRTMSPALEVAQQQMEERLKAEFLAKHEDLKGYEPLLEQIKDRLVAQKRQFKSKEELFEAVSTEARSIIDKVFKSRGAGTAGTGGVAKDGVSSSQSQTHRMSTVVAGGQGGAGAGAGGTGDDKPGWLKALS